jgi:hypothetical protein
VYNELNMAQSIHHIEQEITDLKVAILSAEAEIREINQSILEAEKHVLDEDKVKFWEPKLSSLREDKIYLLKKEDKLQEEALVLEKSRLACIEAQTSEFGFFDMEATDDSEASSRPRNTTWAGDHIAISDNRQAGSGSGSQEEDVKKVESSPSIMTRVEENSILNHDPNANLQGQNRRPHMGNLKSKAMDMEDSYNVFDVTEDDEDMPLPSSAPPPRRDVSDMSAASETSEQGGDKPYSVGKFLHEFFDASESLVLAQGERNNSNDGDSTSTPKNAKGQLQALAAAGIQPSESTHDFSVFGAEMYNDSDSSDADEK